LGLERSPLYKKCQQLGIDLQSLRKPEIDLICIPDLFAASPEAKALARPAFGVLHQGQLSNLRDTYLCYSLIIAYPMPANLGWETEFIRALRMHLYIVIPVATLLTKVLIRVFSREEFDEVMRTVANLPLELMLIAMSFMLGALSGLSDAYIARFANQSDADLFAALVIIGIFFLSLIINRLIRFLKVLLGKLFVAHKQFRELAAQPTIPGTVPNIAIAGRILWAMVYCTLMVLVLVLCFGMSVITLAYVLHLIQ
jgi:hypothetical protein